MCEENYTCNDLRNDYGHSICPHQNKGLTPFQSPIDNCACMSAPEYNAMYDYAWAGHCKNAPAFKKSLPAVSKIRICSPDTDSDSDCVRIGSLRRTITGSRNQKQQDDLGNYDESNYVDSDCDPRFSSCDTNSNSDHSNTDTDTEVPEKKKKKLQNPPPLSGRLADIYAKKYGVRLPSREPNPKHHGHHGKHHGPRNAEGFIDTRSLDTDGESGWTSYDSSLHSFRDGVDISPNDA